MEFPIAKHQRKWDTQRILLHLGFWVVYFCINHLLFSPVTFQREGLVTSFIYVSVPAVAAYLNLYLLIPRLLDRKQYVAYVFSLLLLILSFTFLLGLSIYGWFQFIYPPAWDSLVANRELLFGSIYGGTLSTLFLTMGIFLVRRRILSQQREQALEKSTIETELKFLKNQLNPHFLFNALNSIYFLIRKDPDLAEQSLAGFSDMLRYQLYGANERLIELKQEINFLQQYASLAQLRKKADQLQVDWQLPESLNGEKVAPLLLLPFVENAFKHVANKAGKIRIGLELEAHQLHFQVVNNIEAEPGDQDKLGEGGIGLVNVRRRLELLYPGRHELKVAQNDERFEVHLQVPIDS